jgi:hypothetical protein
MVFLAQFSFKKLGWHLPFFLSSSNRNCGKAFAVLSFFYTSKYAHVSQRKKKKLMNIQGKGYDEYDIRNIS